MSKARREEQHAAIREEIKGVARRLMGKEGTAGVSIRAIGREMQMTAPALYHYYPGRDALITDLIVDAFQALADRLEQVRDASTAPSAAGRLREVLLAYRAWALAFPVDFQLIYGNPIPGYEAPEETTVPAATRGLLIIAGLIAQALPAPQPAPRLEARRVPAALEAHFQALGKELDLPPLAVYLATTGWPLVHGILMLELFNHIQPVVGNIDAFYEIQIDALLQTIGLKE